MLSFLSTGHGFHLHYRGTQRLASLAGSLDGAGKATLAMCSGDRLAGTPVDEVLPRRSVTNQCGWCANP